VVFAADLFFADAAGTSCTELNGNAIPLATMRELQNGTQLALGPAARPTPHCLIVLDARQDSGSTPLVASS
jgi:hypothetical protein